MPRWPLLGSLVANLLLLGALAYEKLPWPQDTAATASLAQPTQARLAQAKEIFAAAAQAGLSSESAKAIFAALLADATQRQLPDQYWQPTLQREQQLRVTLYERQEAARQIAIAALGPSVAADDRFAPLFRPLDTRFSFLSASKQQQLQRLLIEAPRAKLEDSLQQLLTPQELTEYHLRESPAAQRLASSGIQFSEREFREAYALLGTPTRQANSAAAPVDGGSAQPGRQLAQILGAERYTAYVRAQDPAFRLLSAIGERHGLQSASIEQAYGAVQTSIAELLSIRAEGSVARSGSSNEAAIKARRDRELEQLLGKSAYLEAARNIDLIVAAMVADPQGHSSSPATLSTAAPKSAAERG